MKEDFLHYVWKTLSFEPRGLRREDGEVIHIQQTGFHNHDQGPDFSSARIQVGYMVHHGNVEIHVNSREWYLHKHHLDPLYNNVILHVVHTSDGEPIYREDGTKIPEICLEGRIAQESEARYNGLAGSMNFLPCGGSLRMVPEFIIKSWMVRQGVSRVEEKAETINSGFNEHNWDWEQVLWEELAYVMGGKVNGEAFRWIAKEVPIKYIQKEQLNPLYGEVMLLGCAGMLEEALGNSPAEREMIENWAFLSGKYSIRKCPIPLKFMRMRPVSFPGVRLSQLATIGNLFHPLSYLLVRDRSSEFMKSPIAASSYWQNHYRFGHEAKPCEKSLGAELRRRILINVIAPLSWLYFSSGGETNVDFVVSELLESLPAEDNKIIREFAQYGISPETALESQGLIQMKKDFCSQKRCMECNIGHEIMREGIDSDAVISEPLPWRRRSFRSGGVKVSLRY